MSCSSCGCDPCTTVTCDASNEPLASALNNFIVAFFGSLTKTCVNNQVVWVLPCDLDSGITGYPRVAGEGLACYFLRVFETISAGTLVKVSSDDTTPGNLEDKIQAGVGMSSNILNPGGNEVLELSSLGQVRVSSNDTNLEYLVDKLVKSDRGGGVTLPFLVLNPGGAEQLLIDPVITSEAISASNIDWSLSYTFRKTLAANTTFTFTNEQDGKTIIVAITNTAGNFTATWPVAVQWANGSEPVLTLGAKTDVFTFVNFNGTIYASVVQNMS